MITRRLIPTIIACSALLAIAAVAGAENTRTTKQLDQVKRATARFKDVSKAESAGYVRAGECTKSGSGAMGVHYINGKLLGDPRLDIRKPEVLLYEPQRNGSMKLVGVEYFVLDNGQRAPRILGQRFDGPMTHGGTAPSHYDLHVWTVRRNPRGVFAPYNPRVSCAAGSDAAGSGATAAADSGARAAAISKPRVAKFLAYVSGKQTTTWKVPRHGVGSSCQGQRYLEAGGTETVRFSSKPTKIIVWTHRGYGPFVKYGTWKFLSESASGMATSGRVARTGTMKYTLDPGVCFDAGDPTTDDTGPYDCGEKTFASTARRA